MMRGVAIALFLAAGGACFFALAGTAPGSADRAAVELAASGKVADVADAVPENPSVRIVHELIAVPIVTTPPIRKAAAEPVTRVRLDETKHDKPGFAMQAKRILLGDGRYRPQPFPTVDD